MTADHSSSSTPQPVDPNIIDASPTKELFIEMLTRDIALVPAIVDLVDNCADGARRLRGTGRFTGLWARVEVAQDEFRITDNCGGIDIETARKYAFRFGRTASTPSIKHSIGQFGVGMKRAIFKMGRLFEVESATPTGRFVVAVDVAKWAQKPEWEFEFKEIAASRRPNADQVGTSVTVLDLHRDVQDTFRLNSFLTELQLEIAERLRLPIAQGLSVTLNQIPVDAPPLRMLADAQLAPASKELKYTAPGLKPVKVRLFCGLGKSEDPDQAGWHIYCNGRLILGGDKTAVTGWGERDGEARIPGFHGQYNHLRGYAYFDSDDAGRLPWNTTKTGVNTDSVVYRAVRLEMMMLMRPVLDFLNRLKEEKQSREESERGPLEAMVESAKEVVVEKIKTRLAFETPDVYLRAKRGRPELQRIQYDRPLARVNEVKRKLKASTFKEVGERTFDYFYDAEVKE